MRTYKYVEPGEDNEPVTYTLTEADILATYFERWKVLMHKAGKAHLISPQHCIEDWIVVNWAEEVK